MKSRTLLATSATLATLACAAFTPIRPLSSLGEQDAEHIVARAPVSAQVTVPRRFVTGKNDAISTLTSLTNALTNGQIVLQGQLREVTLKYISATNDLDYAERRAQRLDSFRDYLVEQRDKATLPSTKALYQALIDRIDQQ